jgi:hypothetical protein
MRTVRHCLLVTLSLVAGALGAGCGAAQTAAVEALRIQGTYGEIPKGVVLEGMAAGFEPLGAVAYDKKADEFVIGGQARYHNPVSRRDFVTILNSLRADDRFGVSLTKIEGQVIAYGKLDSDSRIAQDMFECDRLLCRVTFGFNHLLQGVKLPGGYVPQQVKQERPCRVVACFSFCNYRFEKRGNNYVRSAMTLEPIVMPVRAEKTPQGGHLVDQEALQKGLIAAEDLANAGHIRSNQEGYLQLPVVAPVVRYGEAAAFARLLRDSGVDLDALLKQMR